MHIPFRNSIELDVIKNDTPFQEKTYICLK